ncbi:MULTISPECIES: MOSC domain-containing protein [unclassified Ruegeria]|uniref:MOSC domain-containing protein n=1 Tax=unclassified Ruegeria TaxID=2625375 RepID=UPI0014917AB7|nr:MULTISPECIES: sulfurase [unclassified Ruegeria]NOD77114.1 sulfurase [Ruegeria sp. HKCCD4332]NOD89585.1 sulfurase [Ruegeria sp. HKCCD4318]NOE13908.1 sulfurase [Ruegeria sp. HKCCD4318-2]NOG08155.1 sulfurase [Ruegeria sp. HKCCD4315]
MPFLRETEYAAEVVWLGYVPAGQSLRAEAVQALNLGFDGVKGERHAGVNRASCVRVKNLYSQGTEIRNVRQLSVLSVEELEQIALEMDLDALDPAYLGASIVLKGIPDFSHVPPSSRLQAGGGLTITVDMENAPCVLPGREIEADQPGHGAAFKPAAVGRRGITGWVERPGRIELGDRLALFVPDQPNWAP